MVDVTVSRNGEEKVIPVTLVKLEVYQIEELGLEVKNINKSELRSLGIQNGVKVNRALTKDMERYNLSGIVITKINDTDVADIDDVKSIMDQRSYNEPIKMTFVNDRGETQSFIFR